VYSLDVFATLCDLCGIEAPPDVESRSLVGALHGTGYYARTHLCAAYMDCQRMIVERRWKLIRYHVNGVERVQLFDLERDPHELHNLATGAAASRELDRLRSRLSEWQEGCGDPWMRDGAVAPDGRKPRRRSVTPGTTPALERNTPSGA
jgi:choline-sulfatase